MHCLLCRYAHVGHHVVLDAAGGLEQGEAAGGSTPSQDSVLQPGSARHSPLLLQQPACAAYAVSLFPMPTGADSPAVLCCWLLLYTGLCLQCPESQQHGYSCNFKILYLGTLNATLAPNKGIACRHGDCRAASAEQPLRDCPEALRDPQRQLQECAESQVLYAAGLSSTHCS